MVGIAALDSGREDEAAVGWPPSARAASGRSVAALAGLRGAIGADSRPDACRSCRRSGRTRHGQGEARRARRVEADRGSVRQSSAHDLVDAGASAGAAGSTMRVGEHRRRAPRRRAPAAPAASGTAPRRNRRRTAPTPTPTSRCAAIPAGHHSDRTVVRERQASRAPARYRRSETRAAPGCVRRLPRPGPRRCRRGSPCGTRRSSAR